MGSTVQPSSLAQAAAEPSSFVQFPEGYTILKISLSDVEKSKLIDSLQTGFMIWPPSISIPFKLLCPPLLLNPRIPTIKIKCMPSSSLLDPYEMSGM